MSTVKITSLGGVQENGKNLYVVEVDERLFILDAGLKYPTVELYGVDVVIPDIDYLVKNKDRVVGIFLSHGHEDHIGSVSQILKEFKTPIYASKFTIALLNDALRDENLNPADYKIIEVSGKSKVVIANLSVRFFEVAHNIPDCLGIVINTPDGNIIYTGNYTFDQNSKIDYLMMYNNLTRYAKEGVLALMTESLGANNDQSRGTILEFKHRLNNIFIASPGRIVCSLFSSDLQRIQQIIDTAVEFKKKVAIIGRKTQRIVNQAMNLGYLKIPAESLVNLRYVDDKNTNNDKDLVVLVTGERHEPYFMLQRMSKKIDRLVRLEESDTIIILTNPYLGTEKMASRTLDMLYRVTSNVKVFKSNLLPVAFACREEIKEMINVTKPKYIIPVIGEYRHQYALRVVANCVGYGDDRVIIPDQGDIMTFNNGEYIGMPESCSVGEVMMDGKAVGDVGDVVMRDRELLAEDGVVLIVANINPKTKKVIAGPEIVSKGFIFTKESEEVTNAIAEAFKKISEKQLLTKFINWSDYKNDLKNEINRCIYRMTKRNPIIIPVLISTDLDVINKTAEEKPNKSK